MIARNFVKYPEALRFQREMFSNGYHNSPRIMRLMECVFDWTPSAPDWWKEAKGRARNLANRVKKSIGDFFKDSNVIQMVFGFIGGGMTLTLDKPKTVNSVTAQLMKRAELRKHITGDYLPTPDLNPYWCDATKKWEIQGNGGYRSFCQKKLTSRIETWDNYKANA